VVHDRLRRSGALHRVAYGQVKAVTKTRVCLMKRYPNARVRICLRGHRNLLLSGYSQTLSVSQLIILCYFGRPYSSSRQPYLWV
jgi:hypothetical protein